MLASIGTLLASRGNDSAAETTWRQAWTVFRDLGAPEASPDPRLADGCITAATFGSVVETTREP